MGIILGGEYNSSQFTKQWIVIIFGLALLGLVALLIVIPRYHMQQQMMAMAKESVVRSNMKAIQVTLEQYMAEDGRGYPVTVLGVDPGRENPMFEFIHITVKRIQNPFDHDVPAVAVSRRDPPFWQLFKPGQVIYVPLGIEEDKARGYAIYGVGQKGPLTTVLDNRPIIERRVEDQLGTETAQ